MYGLENIFYLASLYCSKFVIIVEKIFLEKERNANILYFLAKA